MIRGVYNYQLADLNPEPKRTIQYVEKPIDDKSMIRLDTTINTSFNNCNANEQCEVKKKKVFCPKFNEYKSYLHKLQHGGFPQKDYSHINRVTNIPITQIVCSSPTESTVVNNEKRIINIKTTVLHPYPIQHQFNNGMSGMSGISNITRYPPLKANIYNSNSLIPTKFNLNLYLVSK